MRLNRFSASALCLLSIWTSGTIAQNAADYFVHSLPGAPDGPLLKMHAGHIEVSPEVHGNLFFWHFQNRHIANKQRTVIWLNGGPGCSSMDGALMEIGPYRVREGGELQYNNGSWDEFANVLFVDNPVGTGYSYVDVGKYVKELEEMADEMVIFLTKWFDIFPEYATDDLYISGESYAGQHIPYIAKAILERNRKNMAAPWALKGLLIGNGWISPADQYPAYLEYSYKSGLIEAGSNHAAQLEQSLAVCKTYLGSNGDERVDNPNCEGILNQILDFTQDSSKSADSMERCVNMYDIRLRDSYSSCGMNWPPDLKDVTPYLRRDEVKRALNVDPNKSTGWAECNGNVGGALRQTTAAASVRLLPSLLEQVPIVLFSGEKDLICNHIGTEEMINRMSWNGGKGFEISPGVWAPRQQWTFEDQPAGIYQKARNLTYILFYNSSHMVPFDYPRRTRDMLDRFMGVDIGSIGGTPANSRLDGEKGMETSVGGHPNSTVAEKEEHDRLQAAAWHAYYKSGEVALVVVIILAVAFFYWVWRGRRQQGYDPLRNMREGLETYRHNKDEESGEFTDEAEMHNLGGRSGDRFSVSSDGSGEPYSPAGKISNGYGKHQ